MYVVGMILVFKDCLGLILSRIIIMVEFDIVMIFMFKLGVMIGKM